MTGPPQATEGTRLDPDDWDGFRQQVHALLDICIDRLASAGDHPWRPVPEDFAAAIGLDAPRDAMETLADTILPAGTGNTHPAFFGWVHGTGQAMGLAAELVAATMNANCGGRDHGAIRVEAEVLRWLCATAGLPAGAGGVLTTGTSMATLYAFCAARQALFGADLRERGAAGLPPIAVYAAEGAHGCIPRALRVMGHGSDTLRQVPLHTGAMDTDALGRLVAEDRAAGRVPLAVVGTAGSVNTGTFDDLSALAEIARREKLWFHVDAAFGYWLRLADAPWSDLVSGIEGADSVALDAHKWPGVTYSCGACLARDPATLRAAFADRPDYLRSSGAGLAAGEFWPTDYGLELSRGFRALKFWTAIAAYGPDRIGAVATDNCRQAHLMGELAAASPVLELARPVVSNICVIRPLHGAPEALAAKLQMEGSAVFSTTTLDGIPCLRAAITNHRTTSETVRAAIAALESAVRDAAP
jgi:aromatic-L-amino-acid decarboxylase